MIEEKIVGFICSKSDFKDYDSMINVLGADGAVSFKARGVLKMNSKNANACNYFTIGEYVYQSKSENAPKSLKTAHCIKIYKKPYEDLLVSASYLLICKLLDYVKKEINGYEIAIYCFDLLENGEYPIHVLNYFLKKLCISLGYQPNLDGCINCQKNNHLISFSFSHGGFICQNCFDSALFVKMPVSALKDIYLLLSSEEYVRLEMENSIRIFKMYYEFFKNDLSFPFHNFEFVLQCI